MPLTVNLKVRSFTDTDDEDCQLLEQRANQFGGSNQGGLIALLAKALFEVFPGHPKGFAAKARLVDEYEIVVAEDTSLSPSKVIAAAVVTITSVTYAGSPTKVGWLFDLRVDEDYQRQGLGRALSDEVEKRCLARGVGMLHLTVNRDNTKAKALYKKLGFQDMSLRAPRVAVMHRPAKLRRDFIVLRLWGTKPAVSLAARLTAAAYRDVEMCPNPAEHGFTELLSCELSEGTFIGVLRSELEETALYKDKTNGLAVALSGSPAVLEHWAHTSAIIGAIERGELSSYAGLSMWNGSKVNNWKVLKVFVKKETWLSGWFQGSLCAAALVGLGLWGLRLASQVVSISTWGPGGLVFHIVEWLAFIGILFGAYKSAELIAFILSRDSNKLRARAHAPFQRGPSGLHCLKAVVAGSQSCMRSQGYGMWILNIDSAHPDSEALPSPGFHTDFLQKWLKEPPAGVLKDSAGATVETESLTRGGGAIWRTAATNAYCDPRGV